MTNLHNPHSDAVGGANGAASTHISRRLSAENTLYNYDSHLAELADPGESSTITLWREQKVKNTLVHPRIAEWATAFPTPASRLCVLCTVALRFQRELKLC